MATIENLGVVFGYGNSAAFEAEPKQPNELYFVYDEPAIYLGGVRYSYGKDVTIQTVGSGDTVAGINWDLAAKTLTVLLGEAASAPSIQNALEVAVADCVKHLYAEAGSAIKVDDSDKDNVKLSLNIAQGPNAGNVVIEESANGLRANVDIPDSGLQKVADGDKILKQAGDEISASLSITTEKDASGRQFVILKGVDGVEVSRFDASDFVSAGMLKSVSLEDVAVSGSIHKFLVMEFLVEGGATQTVRADLQELVDTFGVKINGGLGVDNNEFYIDNEVEPSYGVNTDHDISFGENVTLKTIQYNAKGLITGTKDIIFKLPSVGGTVGDEGTKTRLLTFVGLDETGHLRGEYMNVTKNLSAASTNNQIPTAKTVYDAIEAAAAKWTRF